MEATVLEYHRAGSLGGGRTAYVCGACFALVLDTHRDPHREYHNQVSAGLNEALGYDR